MEEKESNKLAIFVAAFCIKICLMIPIIIDIAIFSTVTMFTWNTVGVHLTGMESISFIEALFFGVWAWFFKNRLVDEKLIKE
jgi:hypothetical protein